MNPAASPASSSPSMSSPHDVDRQRAEHDRVHAPARVRRSDRAAPARRQSRCEAGAGGSRKSQALDCARAARRPGQHQADVAEPVRRAARRRCSGRGGRASRRTSTLTDILEVRADRPAPRPRRVAREPRPKASVDAGRRRRSTTVARSCAGVRRPTRPRRGQPAPRSDRRRSRRGRRRRSKPPPAAIACSQQRPVEIAPADRDAALAAG